MKIISTGSSLPKTVVTNDDLAQKIDTTDAWIRTRTGIKTRHLAADETTVSLACAGARRALEASRHVLPEEIGLIIVATSTPTQYLPSVANTVLKALNIPKAMAFDVNGACSGFVYALTIANGLMVTSGIKYALVIGAEVMSNIIDWNDRNTCVLFGDGAGAVLLENTTNAPFIYGRCGGIADVDDALKTGPIADFGKNYLSMKGTDVFKFAVSTIISEITTCLNETNLTANQVDYIVLHQANGRMGEYVAKKLNMPLEKFYSNIAKVGNTSAASIPLVLDEMNQRGVLTPGMKVMLIGFGAGLSFGTVLLEW